MSRRTAALLAGGLGTRIASVTGDRLPKAMVPVAGRPFIDHKLASLARLGIDRVVLLVGHLSGPLVDHVGDGSTYGLDVVVVDEGPVRLGTAGAIAAAINELPDPFWVTWGDSLVVADLAAAEERLDRAGPAAEGLMTVLHNADALETSNVTIAGGQVVAYDKRPLPGSHRHLDYGLMLFRRAAFAGLGAEPLDLGVVLAALIERRRLLAWEVAERFWDVGNPAALAETEAHLGSST